MTPFEPHIRADLDAKPVRAFLQKSFRAIFNPFWRTVEGPVLVTWFKEKLSAALYAVFSPRGLNLLLLAIAAVTGIVQVLKD